jgi:hypothetical protein
LWISQRMLETDLSEASDERIDIRCRRLRVGVPRCSKV